MQELSARRLATVDSALVLLIKSFEVGDGEKVMLATLTMLLLAAQAPGGSAAPAPNENPDQVICRAPEPRLGSRVVRRRICRTRAEWRAHDVNRQQLQRDLQNTPSPVLTDPTG